MVEPMPIRSRWTIAVALIAVAFGIVTIIIGGKTLVCTENLNPDAMVMKAAKDRT